MEHHNRLQFCSYLHIFKGELIWRGVHFVLFLTCKLSESHRDVLAFMYLFRWSQNNVTLDTNSWRNFAAFFFPPGGLMLQEHNLWWGQGSKTVGRVSGQESCMTSLPGQSRGVMVWFFSFFLFLSLSLFLFFLSFPFILFFLCAGCFLLLYFCMH